MTSTDVPRSAAIDPFAVDPTEAAHLHDPAELLADGDGAGRRLAMFVAPALGLALLFGGWELYVRAFDVRPLTLPRPSDVVAHIVDNPGFYADNAWVTVVEAFWGFVAAFVAGVVVATFMAHSRLAERATMPVIVLVQSTPVAALAPVFLIWFGFTMTPKVLIAALFAFIPFVANALTGFRAIDAHSYELLRSVDASRWEIFWKLRFPQALPYLFSAARICVGLALVGAVIGELYGGSFSGLGYQVRSAQARSFVEQMWGSIFVLALIGVVAVIAVTALERWLLRWHTSQSLTT